MNKLNLTMSCSYLSLMNILNKSDSFVVASEKKTEFNKYKRLGSTDYKEFNFCINDKIKKEYHQLRIW